MSIIDYDVQALDGSSACTLSSLYMILNDTLPKFIQLLVQYIFNVLSSVFHN